MGSLRFGKEEREFHFSRFKNHHQPREYDNGEDKTIEQLAAIYFGTPEDELERSLTEYELSPKDPSKMEIDQHLNEAPVQESTIDEKFEVPKKKGDERLPPSELKPLPKDMRYEILDEHNTAGCGHYGHALRGRDDPTVVVLCIRRHARQLIPCADQSDDA